MATPREKFQKLLRKLFQFDCAELDFGIYRILNHKRAVIERFIDKDLLDGVGRELATGALARESGLSKELAEVTDQVREIMGDEALDPEGELAESYHTTPLGKRYLELRARAVQARSSPELEAEIFNHLYAFFSRYYDEGDFMSLRRYSKRDRYAIPYNGEEVHFHWANSDQYYIKTGENFTDYRYKHARWTVEFNLRQANVEQNNNKGPKRFFIPIAKDIAVNKGSKTLTIPFEYRPLSEGEEKRFGKGNGNGENDNGEGKVKGKSKKGQDGILAEAVPAILAAAKDDNDALVALTHEKRKDTDNEPVTLLEHHLRTYTRKNTTDYFIHKDLQGFLERELDFYLKNEVLNLDDLEATGEFGSGSWFQLLRAFKALGRKIIAFLAQIENFQKKLFEKKKFVTEVNYCVTLDRVPEELYPDILNNKAQVEEWQRVFHIQDIKKDLISPGFSQPLKKEFLKAHKHLVIDTDHYDASFTDILVSSDQFLAKNDSIDDSTEGLVLSSDNLQAIELLRERYRQRIQSIYIDPPFNTDASPILYKNGYRSSSWTAMVYDRLLVSRDLLSKHGVLCVTIDDCQKKELDFLLEKVFGRENLGGTVAIRVNPSGRPTTAGLAISHEYAIFARNSQEAVIRRMDRTDEQLERYSEKDQDGTFEWRNFRREGSNSDREFRRRLFYPIYATEKGFRIPALDWDETEEVWRPKEEPIKKETTVLPLDERGKEKTWRWSHESVLRDVKQFTVRKDRAGKLGIYYKCRPNPEGAVPATVWFDAKYSATEHGTALLKHLFGECPFSYPKSVYAVEECLDLSGMRDPATICLDFFAGSGTTAHAAINIAREQGGMRRYILVEMGAYIDTVLKPRIQKVIYSKDWKDGKPISRKGSSHTFKYIRLESYEDALDNIALTPQADKAEMQFEDSDYLLSYMLDFESKSSETFLNVAKLGAPFDYKLRRHGRDEPLPVDLAETFNYLIGLHVRTRRVYMDGDSRYLVYRGMAEGRETAIIWRTTRGWEQKEFEADRDFVAKHKLAEGAEDIYVNTDSFIPGARSLDPVFKRLMFAEE